jgi:hypothetical protein
MCLKFIFYLEEKETPKTKRKLTLRGDGVRVVKQCLGRRKDCRDQSHM